MILPFGLLLAAISLGPLLCANWWLRHYPKVALALGAITLGYYLLGLHAATAIWHTAHEYVSFIVLIGSLYVVSGGIHITVKGQATPRINVLFLFFGALIANVLGTTGASMLLIRPWLRMNHYRARAHHVVFFMFIVSNVGGCLTPIGDPPLFLGYLRGIPFWWVAEHCWPMWSVGVAVLLGIFYGLDRHNYLRASPEVRAQMAEPGDGWRFEGLGNLFFLALVLGAVFMERPPFLREGLMVLAAAGSYATTRKTVHESNHFDFHPLNEVAVLFLGIFATMMPALDWLQGHAGRLAFSSAGFFYWGSGILSSALDNAPTYLSFLQTLFGAYVDQELVGQVQQLARNHFADLAAVTGPQAEQIRQTVAALQKYHAADYAAGTVSAGDIRVCFLLGNEACHKFVLAISIGAVFFGANTYIGNGPNFMVKAIADGRKVRTPTFLGCLLNYTLPYMGPMLLLVWWLFFRP